MSIDLSARTGLPVELTEQNRLEFGDGVDLEKMSARSYVDLDVVAKDESLDLTGDPAYFMYRNVHRTGDEKILLQHNQRFDLTVIPAGMLGEEYVKTSGHYHPIKPGTGIEYPELYYVVAGQATYLMQKHDAEGNITDTILARVKAGQAIIMPPFYGHVTINEISETLVMANWVERNFASVYGDYEQKRGASYYLTLTGIEDNPRYENVPAVRTLESWPLAIADLAETPAYDYIEQIGKLDLIAKPEQYLEDFTIEKLFRI